MKKSIWGVSIIVLLLTSNVWAGKKDYVIIEEAKNNEMTIAQASKAKDETAVTVTGTIVRQIEREYFELQDATAKIGIEVDDDIAVAAQLKNGTKVRVIGEVDTHRYKPTDIEVVKLEILSE